ncbi:MAG: DUF1622 domain-containing protein [Pleurocapsa sp. MO_192.B19]|nr:DUF1622 domain-containing protein [Pleurocapsa sp. MO_192.B19]MDJ0594940.1 DUF1622 domain-containing protein [Pleurocapsa sp. MO_226.B13]
MELIEQLREGLKLVVLLAVFILEAVSVFCVLIGFFKALTKFPGWHSTSGNLTPFLQVRIAFARWLALALEFQLAADILSTTVEPSYEDLIRLSIIAVVRTFLNYFLEKEMAEGRELQAKDNPESTEFT